MHTYMVTYFLPSEIIGFAFSFLTVEVLIVVVVVVVVGVVIGIRTGVVVVGWVTRMGLRFRLRLCLTRSLLEVVDKVEAEVVNGDDSLSVVKDEDEAVEAEEA